MELSARGTMDEYFVGFLLMCKMDTEMETLDGVPYYLSLFVLV